MTDLTDELELARALASRDAATAARILRDRPALADTLRRALAAGPVECADELNRSPAAGNQGRP